MKEAERDYLHKKPDKNKLVTNLTTNMDDNESIAVVNIIVGIGKKIKDIKQFELDNCNIVNLAHRVLLLSKSLETLKNRNEFYIHKNIHLNLENTFNHI